MINISLSILPHILYQWPCSPIRSFSALSFHIVRLWFNQIAVFSVVFVFISVNGRNTTTTNQNYYSNETNENQKLLYTSYSLANVYGEIESKLLIQAMHHTTGDSLDRNLFSYGVWLWNCLCEKKPIAHKWKVSHFNSTPISTVFIVPLNRTELNVLLFLRTETKCGFFVRL